MKTVTVLIPSMRPPYIHSMEVMQIKNISDKLKEKCNLHIIWVVFQSGRINEIKTDILQIIDFKNYENAIQILDEMKPDLILIDGELSCASITFAMAGRYRKIPLVSMYFVEEFVGFKKRWFAIKSRLRLAISSRVFADVSNESKPRKFKMLSFILKEYHFLIKTLSKMDYTIFQLVKFMYTYPRIQLFANSEIPVHELTSGDLNLCSIPHWTKRLETIGLQKSSIALIGNPYFDGLYLQIQESKRTSPSKIDKVRVLFCTSPMHEHGIWTKKEEDEMIIKVIKEVLNHTELEIVIKIHPSSSSIDEYNKLLQNTNTKIKIYQKENLIELLSQHDVMITYGSGSQLLDAILFKKPTVFLDLLNKNEKLNLFFDEDVTIQCNSLNELTSKIKYSISKEVNESAYQSYIEKHLGKFDGKSSDRARDAILELLNSKNLSK